MNLLTSRIQNKFQKYHYRISLYISKPESRFIQEMSLGILKSGTVILNQIAIHIEDRVRLKKSLERFRRHLHKVNWYKELFKAHIQSVAHKLDSTGYALLDLSDIQKTHAKEMEGLGRVRDGSRKGQD